jgi:nucleoside-diphosphate-sugar epimerase
VSGAVAVTGASGYVGGRIVARCSALGRAVVRLVRVPAGTGDVAFDLGAGVDPAELAAQDVDSLVHCAYDAAPLRRDDVHARNVTGTARLLDAAGDAGVRRVVVISTMSAFTGCRSVYGQVKLEIERRARDTGAAIVRPGLVWHDGDDEVGGMVGRLRRSAAARVVPLPAAGSALHLVHVDDLVELLLDLGDRTDVPREAVIAAHPRPWTMRDIVCALADQQGRRPLVVPLPWRPVLGALRAVERIGRPLPFRSDSLVGLVHSDPAPTFDPALALRPFGAAALVHAADGGWAPI